MNRKRGPLMSDALKWELAGELGVQDIVAREGWGGVPARQCGLLVRKAIEFAEAQLAASYQDADNTSYR